MDTLTVSDRSNWDGNTQVFRYPASGQQRCYDVAGTQIDCRFSGQDADIAAGVTWSSDRFILQADDQVMDSLTGLCWSANANPAVYPLTWVEALDFITQLNRQKYLGADDWRMPNRRELRSLVSHQMARPVLPDGHPFQNVFPGWYWSSTSYAGNPAHAWYVHMDGGRMFYGGKDQSFLLWPVRGKGNGLLANTGQQHCFSSTGAAIHCDDMQQDGALKLGCTWPQPRFVSHPHGVLDQLTSLVWRSQADLTGGPVTWEDALAAIDKLNVREPEMDWYLPNIIELESLTDCSCTKPALPVSAPFEQIQTAYWSSTTSVYEADWAWVLYMDKGAVGVGQKHGRYFHVWAVSQP